MFARLTESTLYAQNTLPPPLSGRLICLGHLGLKPWAMVYNRFAVNPTGPQGLSLRSLRYKSDELTPCYLYEFEIRCLLFATYYLSFRL
jgi:hypothetical protein